MADNLEEIISEDSDTNTLEETEARRKRSSKKRYVCPEDNCTATFNRRNRLECHMRMHTGERPFVCLYDHCNKSYARAAHLKRHEQKVHELKEDIPIPLTCSFPKCEIQFKSQRTLNKHIEIVHKERKYVCKTCLKPFRKHQHLKIHEYDHTGIKPFPCPHVDCDKSFILPSRLKRHMKTHAGYQCDAYGCHAIFRTWTLLLQHKKVNHPTTYSCAICDRTFNTRYNLQLHLKIHQEQRETFHCPHPDCPRYYLLEKNLAQHLRSYHEECEFHCNVNGCKARFAHKGSLKRHIKRHSNELFSKKKEEKKVSKTSEGKKPKRRRKRRSSTDLVSAAYLAGYDKNMSKINAQDESCIISCQQNENDMTNDNCLLLSKLKVNVSDITDCVEQNVALDSYPDSNQQNTYHICQNEQLDITMCEKQSTEYLIINETANNFQNYEKYTENKVKC